MRWSFTNAIWFDQAAYKMNTKFGGNHVPQKVLEVSLRRGSRILSMEECKCQVDKLNLDKYFVFAW